MSVEIKIEVTGAEETATGLENIAESFGSKLGEALQEVGEGIVQDAQGAAPVDTGALRDSIEVTASTDTSITVTTGVEYAAFVEFGTSKMDAQPYMQPAFENAKSEIQRILIDAISRR